MKRIKLKRGWARSISADEMTGLQLGGPVICHNMSWTPVLWDEEEDPDFVKSAAIEEVQPPHYEEGD